MAILGRDDARDPAPALPGSRRNDSGYRQLVEAAPVGMYTVGPAGRFTVVNRALAELWGGPAVELVGEHFTRLVAAEDRVRMLARFDRMTEERQEVGPVDFRLSRRDGSERIGLLHSMPLRDAGAVIGTHGVILDVTGKRRTEEELRASEARFRLMVEGSDRVFFFSHDRDGIFDYVSPSAELVIGYRAEEMVGRSYEEFHPRGWVLEEVRRRTDAGLTGEGPGEPYEAVLRARDGSLVHLEITETPRVERGEVVGMTGFARDITRRKQLEEELRQSQKMDAVGQLAGGIAHDFNNLLTTIMGHIQLVLDRVGPREELREDLLEVQRSSERAADLTRQLLAFSRKQVLRPRVVDLNEVVAGVRRLLERLIGEDIELIAEAADEPLRVFADPSQLDQVLMNLAVNARDAMPDGGTLRVRTHRLEPEDPEDGPVIRITVVDTGVGMSEEVKARVFEPFYTTKEPGQGTGLGLSTVYGIVKQSGGRIDLESREGEGTTFHVDLKEATPDSRLSPDEDPPEVEGGSERVLVVEDEPGVRDFCVKLLTRFGYRVRSAASPGEALELLSDGDSPVDLLLTDLVMPGMTGTELMREARCVNPGISSIFMSGYTERAAVRHGDLGDGGFFLEKPFSSEALLRTVREALTAARTAADSSRG